MSQQVSQNKLQRTRQLVFDYLGTHTISENLNRAVNDLVRVRPQDPWLFMSDAVSDWQKCGPLVDTITALHGVDVFGRLGLQFQLHTRAAVNRPPSLSITQPVFRGESFFSQAHDEQKSIESAITDVEELISQAVHGIGVHDQHKIDEELFNVELSNENSPYNLICSASMLACQAAAQSLRDPVFSHLSRLYMSGQNSDGDSVMPTPMMDIINGGRFGRTGINILRIMVIPPPSQSPVEQTQLLSSVNMHARQILFEKYGAGGQVTGLTGGYAPHGCNSVDEALEVVELALANAGWAEKQENESEESLPTIGIVVGADYIYNEGQYEIEQGKQLTSEGLLEFYDALIAKHPKLSYVEDPFAAGDDESWTKFVDKCEGTVSVSGNLYYRCQIPKLEAGQKGTMTVISDLFIKTMTSATEFAQRAIDLNQQIVVSNCLSGSSLLVDLAVALNATNIQIGGSHNLSLLSRLVEVQVIALAQENASTRVSVSQKQSESNQNAETESQQSADAQLTDNELP